MAKRVVRKKEKQDYTWWIVLLVAVVAVITLLFNSGIARFSPEEPVVINPEDDAMMAEDGRMADDPYARPEDDDFVVAMDSDGDDNFAAPPLDADVGGGVSCTWTCACHFELSYSGKCVDSQGWSVDPEVHSPYGTWDCSSKSRYSRELEFSSDDPVICSSPANQLDECKEDEGMKAVCELFDEVEGDKITECIIENSEACVNAGGDYSAKKISSDSEITLQSTSRSSG